MKPLSGALIDYRQKDTLQGQTTYQKISKIEQWVKKSEKGDICLPFCEKKEKALPLCIDAKTPNAPKRAKLYQFFRKIKPPYYIQGHSNFSKKAKALSKVVEGRSLHSVPLASKSIPRKSSLFRPAQQENSAIFLGISCDSRARGGLEKNP